MVEGLTTDRHIITTSGDTLRIYECAEEQQHPEDGAVEAPVACFKAPFCISSLQCFGAAICLGCYGPREGGAVCILSAPFLAA